MASSPPFKVYSAHGEYVASVKYLEDAAALIASCYTEGATIRWGHSTILWTEGKESQPAAESYDFVASHCLLVKGQHGGSSLTPKL